MTPQQRRPSGQNRGDEAGFTRPADRLNRAWHAISAGNRLPTAPVFPQELDVLHESQDPALTLSRGR